MKKRIFRNEVSKMAAKTKKKAIERVIFPRIDLSGFQYFQEALNDLFEDLSTSIENAFSPQETVIVRGVSSWTLLKPINGVKTK